MSLVIEALKKIHRRKPEFATPKMPARVEKLKNRAAQETKKLLDSILPNLATAPNQRMDTDVLDESVLAVQVHKHITLTKVDYDNLLHRQDYSGKSGKRDGKNLVAADFQKSLETLLANPEYSNDWQNRTTATRDYLNHADQAAVKIIDLWQKVKGGQMEPWQAHWESRATVANHLYQMQLIRTGQ